MRTVTVEIKNDAALKFLKDLELIHVIRLIDKSVKKSKNKLSDKFYGCISNETAEELQKQLTQMRDEWQRNIC